jgi:hypothetical protein
MTLTILIALISAFSEAQADESGMISLQSLFTGVRGREILRSSPLSGSQKFSSRIREPRQESLLLAPLRRQYR